MNGQSLGDVPLQKEVHEYSHALTPEAPDLSRGAARKHYGGILNFYSCYLILPKHELVLIMAFWTILLPNLSNISQINVLIAPFGLKSFLNSYFPIVLYMKNQT
jgi:hypothetical protein